MLKPASKKASATSRIRKTARRIYPKGKTVQPPSTFRAYLERHSTRTHRFWEIIVELAKCTVRSGTIGAKGSTKSKTYESAYLSGIIARHEIERMKRAGFADPKEVPLQVEATKGRGKPPTKLIRVAAPELGGADECSLSLDGAARLIGGRGHSVVWGELPSGRVLFQSARSRKPIKQVLVLTSELCALAEEGGLVQLFRMHQMKRVALLKGHTKDLSAMAADATGTWLVTGSYDRTVRIWDLRNNTSQTLRPAPARRSGWIESVSISPEGARVFVAITAGNGESSEVLAYERGAPSPIWRVPSPFDVNAMAVSPDGTALLTVHRHRVESKWGEAPHRGSASRWSTETGKRVVTWKLDAEGTAVAYVGASRAVTLSTQGCLQLWDVISKKELARKKMQTRTEHFGVRGDLVNVGPDLFRAT